MYARFALGEKVNSPRVTIASITFLIGIGIIVAGCTPAPERWQSTVTYEGRGLATTTIQNEAFAASQVLLDAWEQQLGVPLTHVHTAYVTTGLSADGLSRLHALRTDVTIGSDNLTRLEINASMQVPLASPGDAVVLRSNVVAEDGTSESLVP